MAAHVAAIDIIKKAQHTAHSTLVEASPHVEASASERVPGTGLGASRTIDIIKKALHTAHSALVEASASSLTC